MVAAFELAKKKCWLTNSTVQGLPDKLTGPQLVNKFPEFYWTIEFITAFTRAPHLPPILSQMDPVHTHPTFRRSLLILSSHLRLGFPSGLLLSDFPIKTFYAPLLSPIHATRPTNMSSGFDHRNDIWWGIQSIKILFSLFHSPVTSSLLGPNNLLGTLFSKTLNLRASLNVSDHVPHPYKTPSHCLGCNEESVRLWDFCVWFVTRLSQTKCYNYKPNTKFPRRTNDGNFLPMLQQYSVRPP